MIHLRKIILFVFGLISTIIGWSMWMEPQLSSFDVLVSMMENEILRLVSDPFAILGLALMMLGLWTLFMVIVGPWNLPYGIDEILVPSKYKKSED